MPSHYYHPPATQEEPPEYKPLHTRLDVSPDRDRFATGMLYGLTGVNLDKESKTPSGWYMLGEALSYSPGLAPFRVLKAIKGYSRLRRSGLGRQANKFAESPLGRQALEKVDELVTKYPRLGNHMKVAGASALVDTPIAIVKHWGLGKATGSEAPPGLVSMVKGTEEPMSPLEIGPFYAAIGIAGRGLGALGRGLGKGLKGDKPLDEMLGKPEDVLPRKELTPEDEELYAESLERGEPFQYGDIGIDDVEHGRYQEDLLDSRADEIIKAVDEEERVRFRPGEEPVPPEPEHIAEELPIPEYSGQQPEIVDLYGHTGKKMPDEPPYLSDIPPIVDDMPENLKSYVDKRFADKRNQSLSRRVLSGLISGKRRAGLELLGKHHAFRTVMRNDMLKELTEHGIEPEEAERLIEKAIVDFEVKPTRLSTKMAQETDPLAGMDMNEVAQVNQAFSARVNKARNPESAIDSIFGEGADNARLVFDEAQAYYPDNILAAEQSMLDELTGLAYRLPSLSRRAEEMLARGDFDPEVIFPGIKYDLTGGIRPLRRAVYNYVDEMSAEQESLNSLRQIAETDPDQSLVKAPKRNQEPPEGFEEVRAGSEAIWARKGLKQIMEWDENVGGTYWGQKVSRYSGRNILRTFATGINPVFAIKSIPMEMMAQWGTSQRAKDLRILQEYGEDMSEVFSDVANREGLWRLYMDWGGSMLGHHSVTPAGIGEKALPKGWNDLSVAGKFDAMIRRSSTFTEDLMRVSMFRRALKNGHNLEKASKIAIGGEIPDWGKAAVWQARQYLDFQQGGRVIKAVDTAIPYTNAMTQFTFKASNYMLQNPKVAAAMTGMWISMVAGNMWYNRLVNKDGYNQISAREKDNYWIWMIPERMTPYLKAGDDPFGFTRHGYVRIPKAHPLMMVGNPIEAQLEGTMFGTDTRERWTGATDMLQRYSTDLTPAVIDIANIIVRNQAEPGRKAYSGSMVSPEMESDFWRTQSLFKNLGDEIGFSPDRLKAIYSSLGMTSNFVANAGVFGYGKINELIHPEDKMYEEGWFKYAQELGGLKGLINMTEGNKNIHAITEDAKIDAGDDAKRERNLLEGAKSLLMQNKDPKITERLQHIRPKNRREWLQELNRFDASGRNKFMDQYMKHLEGLNHGPRGRAAANFMMSLPADKRQFFWNAMKEKKYETPEFIRAYREEHSRLTGKKLNQ